MLLKHLAIRVVLLCSLVQGGGPPQTSSQPYNLNLRQNTLDPSARWLVQKFGGTSVGKYPVDIASIVARYMDADTKVAIVCSARSGSTKALGTTSLLLRAASEVQRRTRRADEAPWDEGSDSTEYVFHTTVDLILEEHLTAARASVKDADILHELGVEISRDCAWLRSFLRTLQIAGQPISAQDKDVLVGLGERLACKLMTAVLRDQGIDAECISLENIIAGDDEPDGPPSSGFYTRIARAVGERIKQCGSCVPVVTGFFGPVPGSLLRHVGRGYTDLLAALLAVSLNARELQIWKEVEGIFTADPHKVPTARLIPVISAADAAQLTYYGSEVVHPLAIEQAGRDIPIRIKNVRNPDGGGTLIIWDQGNDLSTIAVSVKEPIVVLTTPHKHSTHGFLAHIITILDQFGVVVDLMSSNLVHVRISIEDSLEESSFDALLGELQRGATVTVKRDMAIVSLVGRHRAGCMLVTLAQAGISVEMISQDASVLCVVEGQDSFRALNLIHEACSEP
ncbi:Aspartate/glutamate/uridylate kinase [Roridomyces roridus]|uniref:Aspartokinase n=1 Tax=Roridomyces roridus TaxID=1738132 RepID=A0AAD7CAG0_9AGAR|nr:Aspartate/glutamate/uridylate kinase [Roridomyces roridus]